MTLRAPFNTFILGDAFINFKTTRYQSCAKTCLNFASYQNKKEDKLSTFVIIVSHNELCPENCVQLKFPKMTAQKKSLPSFATFISILSIVFYCAGFLRVELELNEHKERLNALENAVAGSLKPPTSEPNHAKTTTNVPGKFVLSTENY